jgi:hypothetical protein
MSISEFFNKKARTVAATAALAMGGAAGFAGMEIATYHQPGGPSNFTMSNAPKNISEEQFVKGYIPGLSANKAEIDARAAFTQRIDVMAAEQKNLWSGHAGQPVDMTVKASLTQHAVSFARDLRTSENLSERDYQALLKDYDARVNYDVTMLAGNYHKGIAFNQECQVGQAFGNIFGDDEDQTADQASDEIGACMLELQQNQTKAALEGGAAGFAIGGLIGLPLYLRRRKAGPKVNKSPKAG